MYKNLNSIHTRALMNNITANTNKYTKLSHVIQYSAHTPPTNFMMSTVFKD